MSLRLRSSLIALVLLTSLAGAPVAGGSTLGSHTVTKAKVFHAKIVTDPNTVGAYKPGTITVHRGDKIVFSNKSNAIHTVTARDGKSFDSKNITIGHSWTYTAKKVGTFSYYCVYHALMHGKIIVKS